MTIFASRAPEDLEGAEPKPTCPYYFGAGSCNQGCWEEPRCITDEPLHGWGYVPPQHNEPNPILVAFRAMGGDAAVWHAAVFAMEIYGGHREWDDSRAYFHSLTKATDDQVAHAERVLNRLALAAEVSL